MPNMTDRCGYSLMDATLIVIASDAELAGRAPSSIGSCNLSEAMKIDTTSLGNAVRRLREGIARYEREPTDEQIRDGLMQRFEFTYELSHKMLRRSLKETAASPP